MIRPYDRFRFSCFFLLARSFLSLIVSFCLLLLSLARSGGKVSGPGGAAELLGIKTTTLASKIKAMGIRE